MTSEVSPVEDCAPYILMLGVGCIPVVVALSRHAIWGVEPTVGLLFVAVALRSLVVIGMMRMRQRRTSRAQDHHPGT